MTAADPLAPIRARAEAYADHGTPGLHAPKDRAALLAALDAVMAMHKPLEYHEGIKLCAACSSHYNHVAWPCPTVAAVSAALGGGE